MKGENRNFYIDQIWHGESTKQCTNIVCNGVNENKMIGEVLCFCAIILIIFKSEISVNKFSQ